MSTYARATYIRVFCLEVFEWKNANVCTEDVVDLDDCNLVADKSGLRQNHLFGSGYRFRIGNLSGGPYFLVACRGF